MAPRWTLCKCGARYERIKRKCPSCGKTRAKRRVPKHAQTLRDHTYEHYVDVSLEIHGGTPESCGVCQKPRSGNKDNRRHDRDHGHLQGDPSYGKPRGLACVKHNRLMPRELNATEAYLIWQYLQRVEDHYTKPEEESAQRSEQS